MFLIKPMQMQCLHGLGLDENQKLLMVCHCYREEDTVIRIISARKASKPEDVKNIIKGICTRKIDILTLDPEEQRAFERYKKAHGYS